MVCGTTGTISAAGLVGPVAKPEFEEHQLPELGFVAVEAVEKAAEAGAELRRVHILTTDEAAVFNVRKEQAGERTECGEKIDVVSPF